MTVTCPNCSKPHAPIAGNNYCPRCAGFLRKIGAFDGIDDRGELFRRPEPPVKGGENG